LNYTVCACDIYYVAVLEEDGFNSEHPFFHCFVAEPVTEDSGDAVVPNNGELFDTGNYCAELENKSSMND
jgi:hypothetical protein